ncbi:ferritin-like protein [Azospirillum sp. Sh1]|uniref:ferritin-like domain-containing protein n=1 Tax=Azospirillum sp. Sh1 TaxID=2607285 RepID=UPI0011EF3E80|nr:ferritin-like protein [Azospirillum sp. Sh1]KAA0572603.1 hypothetical protein FZ029_23245 [Azospirillum sp. Sh1]
MLKLQPHFAQGIDTVQVLRNALQSAVEFEHATLPAYLTALYSIKPGTNREAAAIIGSVTVQEMLHMTIAANILNAVGGHPVIDKPGFIPVYPGPLPMGIHEGLTVSLGKLTRGLVYDVFMTIEEPEVPQAYPVKQPALAMFQEKAAAAREPGFATIGEFYAAISKAIGEMGEEIFTGDPSYQVVDNTWFPPDQLFPVTDVASAQRAIEVIVEQGEGTPQSPREADNEAALAHYYRLAQIVYARRLVKDRHEPLGWSYSGAPVGIDPAGIWNLYPNAKTVDYPEGSRARTVSQQFNTTYTALLTSLHVTFNGQPERLRAAIGLMYELKLTADQLVAIPLPGTDYTAAPTFEYSPVNV